MTMRPWAPCVAVLVMVSSADLRRAHAGDAPAAELLYREGRALLEQGKYEEACPKLEASEALDAGAGTAFHLARCYELAGRVASAWAKYSEVAVATHAARQYAREAVARERVQRLAPKLSYLVITVPEGARASGARLFRNELEVPAAAWGEATPVDPGTYVLRVEAPGFEPWTETVVVLGESRTIAVTIPALRPRAVAAPAPDEAGSPAESHGPAMLVPAAIPSTFVPVAVDAEPSRFLGLASRQWAAVLVGSGLAASAVGAYYAGQSVALHDASASHCDESGACDALGYDDRKKARSAGDAATAAFIAAGALATGGVVLWILHPGAPQGPAVMATPAVGAGHATLLVRGRF